MSKTLCGNMTIKKKECYNSIINFYLIGGIMLKKEIFTIPNIITIVRLIGALILSYYILTSSNLNSLIIVFVFIIIASTDFMDGMIARKYNMASKLGKILDPLCDKAIGIVLAFCLIIKEMMPLWTLLPLLIRDIIISSCYLYNLIKNKEKAEKSKPSIFAKMKTIFQSASIGAVLITLSFNSLALIFILLALVLAIIDLDETIRTTILNKQKRFFSIAFEHSIISNIFKLGEKKRA